MQKLNCALLMLASVSLSACSLMLTPYERPEVPEVVSFSYQENYVGQRVDKDFYKLFADPLLDDVITQALAHNSDLRESYLNVNRALYELGLSRTSLLPDFNASLGANVSRELEGGASSNRSSSSSLGLSYEIDLFSRLEASRLASAAEFKASALDYLSMRLTVISTVAEAYWQLSYAKEALALGEMELEDAKKRLAIIENRYRLGMVDKLELDTAKVNFLQIKDTYDSRVQGLGNARNALNYLLGKVSAQNVETSSLDKAQSPQISLEIPSLLLARRPDLMASEERLKAAYLNADEARLAFYPSFTLQASLQGGSSDTFGRFLSDPLGTLGAAITFPFLNYQDLKYQEKISLVDRDLAKLNFVDTYLVAVREVYDATENLNYYQKALVNAKESLDLATLNQSRYEKRYLLGSASLTDYLDACDTRRNAAISYLNNKLSFLNAQMTLMVALGGGTDEKSLHEVEQQLAQSEQSKA